MFSENHTQIVHKFFGTIVNNLRVHHIYMYIFFFFCLRAGMVGAFYRHTVQITAWEINVHAVCTMLVKLLTGSQDQMCMELICTKVKS